MHVPPEYNGLIGIAVFGGILFVWGLIASKGERREHALAERETGRALLQKRVSGSAARAARLR
jgi:hypothetical protein